MKTALLALVLTVITPVHITGAFAGAHVSFPARWLILAAEGLAAGALTWLGVRILRRFRSSPWPRPAFAWRGAP
jgi:hypothetical protein